MLFVFQGKIGIYISENENIEIPDLTLLVSSRFSLENNQSCFYVSKCWPEKYRKAQIEHVIFFLLLLC